MLRGWGDIEPSRPAALQGRGFDPARSSGGVAAQMSVMSRRVVDCCDRHRLLGSRRKVGERDAHAVYGCRDSARLNADRLAPHVKRSSSTALKYPQRIDRGAAQIQADQRHTKFKTISANGK